MKRRNQAEHEAQQAALAETAPDEVEAPGPRQYKFVLTRHQMTQVLRAFDVRGTSETHPFTPPTGYYDSPFPVTARVVSADCVEAVWMVSED